MTGLELIDDWGWVCAAFSLGGLVGSIVSYGSVFRMFARKYLAEKNTLCEACAAVEIGRDDLALSILKNENKRIDALARTEKTT